MDICRCGCMICGDFVVAHRLSNIKKVNEIAVIVCGHVVRLGTSDGLMAQDDIIRDLYSLRFRENGESA